MHTDVNIPGYRITDEIGQGGMARVVSGVHLALDRPVAIKILTPDLSTDPAFTERFLREARGLAQLAHPNILAVFDVGVHDGVHYMVTEYLAGGSLRDRIGRGLPLDETLAIAQAMAEALSAAHRRDVVHRDIKPSNVLFRSDGTPVLADFGIAAFRNPADSAAPVTQVGTVLGTPGYMSPEQLSGRPVDGRSDIYGLGVVLYEMLTGQLPYRGDEPLAVAMQHVNDPIPRLPPELAPVQPLLETLLAKAPEDRPADAARVAEALRRLTPAESGTGVPAPPGAKTEAATNIEAPPAKRSGGMLAWLSGWFAAAPQAPADRARGTPTGSDERVPRQDPVTEPYSQPAPAPQHRAPPGRASDNEGATMIAPLDADLARGAEPPPGPARSDATRIVQAQGASAGDVPVALLLGGSSGQAQQDRRIDIAQFPFSVGRGAQSDLTLADDLLLSRRHVEISFDNGAYQIVDLSSNGVFVNGRKLRPGTREALLFGDAIVLSAATSLTFVANIEPLPDLSGTLLDERYHLERQLHASIKASTYIAGDSRLPRTVAIKIFSPDLGRIAHYQEAFRQQAEITAQLTHPHIARVLDSGSASVLVDGAAETLQYLCLEQMTGGNLEDKLRRGRTIELPVVSKWVRQLARALAYAHDKGIVHGALKPTAVVFDDEDNPYLADFALASREGVSTGPAVLGAPAFIAPEQWANETVTRAVDQFALAVLTYLAISGTHPFEGQGDPEVRRRNFSRPPFPVHEEAARNGNEAVPEPVSAVLARALAVDPAARYESVQAFADALRAAAAGRRAGGRPRVFISYHRESSAGWALLFARELEEKHALRPYVDTQAVDRASRFPERLAQAIADTDVVVCLLSQETLDSEWVREEIRIAAANDKPMIPVFQESFLRPENEADLPGHLLTMLSFDGVHLLDQRNIHVHHTIADVARLVQETIGGQ